MFSSLCEQEEDRMCGLTQVIWYQGYRNLIVVWFGWMSQNMFFWTPSYLVLGSRGSQKLLEGLAEQDQVGIHRRIPHGIFIVLAHQKKCQFCHNPESWQWGSCWLSYLSHDLRVGSCCQNCWPQSPIMAAWWTTVKWIFQWLLPVSQLKLIIDSTLRQVYLNGRF